MTNNDSHPIESTEILTYEQSRDQLIHIVSQLEQGGLGLDESIALWEKGEKLIQFCRTKLDNAAERISQVLSTAPDAVTSENIE